MGSLRESLEQEKPKPSTEKEPEAKAPEFRPVKSANVARFSANVCNMFFVRKGWAKVTPEEELALGEALTETINRRGPSWFAEYWDLINLGIVAVGIFAARAELPTDGTKSNNGDTRPKGAG